MKIIAKCPTCGKAGQVTRKMKLGILGMECLYCGEKWESSSGKCPDCGSNNGYAGSGRCITCYKTRLKGKIAGLKIYTEGQKMKSTGIVRGVDDLGRVVIPKEIHRTFGIKEGESVEFYTDEEGILLKKHNPGCIFCGNLDKITEFKGQKICRDCAQDLKGE